MTEVILLLLISCTRNHPKTLESQNSLFAHDNVNLWFELGFEAHLGSPAGFTGYPHGCNHLEARLRLGGVRWPCFHVWWYRQLAGPHIPSRLAKAASHGSWGPKAAKKKDSQQHFSNCCVCCVC